MFSESGTTAHLYLFIAAVVLFSIFLVYVYVHNHRTSAEDSGFWTKVFYHNDMGEYLPHITHDDDVPHHALAPSWRGVWGGLWGSNP